MSRFFAWIYEEGLCDEATRNIDWIGYGMEIFTGQKPRSEFDRIVNTIAIFTGRKTKAELFEGAVERQLLIAPITNARDVLNIPHLAERGVWETVDSPRGPIRLPGRWAIFSASPQPELGRPPRLGEHNREILSPPSRAPRAVGSRNPSPELPLKDLKVLDFSWVMAGPAASRVLADYGATVVRVESSQRLDLSRSLMPRIGPSPEDSILQQNLNAGKLGLNPNLKSQGGREVIFDLVRWADVVFDSFAPGAMKSWGFDYENLRQINPQIVQISSCLMGQWGELASYAGFGNLAAALSGFYEITGWADRDPVGPYGAYTDTLAPRFAVLAIMGALEYRRRTGHGQFIDLSQAESALHFYTQALLEFQTNDKLVSRNGNADRFFAPHGVYPAAGEDRWIALACETNQQWKSLCLAMSRADLGADQGLSAFEGRLARARELDDLIAEWSCRRDALELEAILQARGVPAHHVAASADTAIDPQLAFRHHLVTVPHPMHGRVVIEGTRF
jgi:crotonobetainyl-CoA:carnitine CoA-transferase CaiB-like acyl-CoA transferase